MEHEVGLYDLAGDGYHYNFCATLGLRQRVVHADPAINFLIGKPLEKLLKVFGDGKIKLVRVLDERTSAYMP